MVAQMSYFAGLLKRTELNAMEWTSILSIAVVKGFVMSVVVLFAAAAEPFWHQILLVVISGSLTIIGVILSAVITAERVREHLQVTQDSLDRIETATGDSEHGEHSSPEPQEGAA